MLLCVFSFFPKVIQCNTTFSKCVRLTVEGEQGKGKFYFVKTNIIIKIYFLYTIYLLQFKKKCVILIMGGWAVREGP